MCSLNSAAKTTLVLEELQHHSLPDTRVVDSSLKLNTRGVQSSLESRNTRGQ